MNSVVCLSNNRIKFLKEFIQSFEENSEPGTELRLCLQGCTDGSNLWVTENCKTLKHQVYLYLFPGNIGLNRYDEIVKECPDGIIIDTDDDSLLPKGYEKAFESVLKDSRVGWVGILEQGTSPLKLPSRKEHEINGYHVVEAAVGGGLAATRKLTWESMGGFGEGETLFDPEDARYQRRCIANGMITGMITDLTYVHRSSWETLIQYGYARLKIDNLFNAMKANFISEEDFRIANQEYLMALEKSK
jgi:hypothetical protein